MDSPRKGKAHSADAVVYSFLTVGVIRQSILKAFLGVFDVLTPFGCCPLHIQHEATKRGWTTWQTR